MTKTMECPACDQPMVRENFASALVGVCADGCKGLWFDAGDLAKLDYEKKGYGPALERAVATQDAGTPRRREQLACPRCNVAMEAVEYEQARSVVVDECSACGGVYLDAGELARIRHRAPTPDEQASARRHRRARRRSRQRVLDEKSKKRQAQVACMTSLLLID